MRGDEPGHIFSAVDSALPTTSPERNFNVPTFEVETQEMIH